MASLCQQMQVLQQLQSIYNYTGKGMCLQLRLEIIYLQKALTQKRSRDPQMVSNSVRPKPVTDTDTETETDTESQNSPNPTPIPNPKK